MNFETATDLELEQALACLVYKCEGWELSKTGGSFHSCGIDGSASYVQPIPKYCTDISATWPLMIEHGISIQSPSLCGSIDKWTAKYWESDDENFIHLVGHDKDPLRAVVVCLIKTLENKHERT
ncbi:hypothetical protein AWJ09_04345 [Vibrio cholerae]|uniref:hypothetical protein n=1 Tax=Vibrio cholerae TaxID=666 RepID=UPI0007C58C5D|nr:hypothetical protein [Vibrio cholerae]KAA1217097.1 hypothetical protein F0Q05_06835 [Vibrio cholerae]KAA1219473.1 hypothetical protein F0P99_08780 [Vibrio cholerae]MTB75135.1 hypothetical protein [Vibrio cholerae O1 biovar El Tor]OAE83135.1 hypothetical protein AWJ09_04345 [Vibrio cholerae]TYW51272.1 hypothetical protein FY559_16325 [Vibrio cholerae]